MAKVNTGILGEFRGRVGPIIGSAWKGISYVKVFVAPGNPQTVKQVYQRAIFSFVQSLASALLTQLVHKYWKQFEDKASAYNLFIGTNARLQDDFLTGGPIFAGDFSKVKMTKGTLEPVAALTSFTYTTGTGDAVAVWDDTTVGSGQATDTIIAIIWDTVNRVAYFSDTAVRSDTTITLTLPAGLTAGDLEGWIGVAQGTDIPYLTGNSLYQQLTV